METAIEAVNDQIEKRNAFQAKLDKLSLALAEAMGKEGFSVSTITAVYNGKKGPYQEEMVFTVHSAWLKDNPEGKWPL